MKPINNPSHGFSLIELMVVVAIVALLTAVAVPQYQQYVLRAHRIEAQTTLLQAASWLERVATAQGSYPLDANHLGPGLPSSLQTSPQGHYAITLSSTDGSRFTLSAQPQGAQASDSCGILTLNETATPDAYGGERCWQ